MKSIVILILLLYTNILFGQENHILRDTSLSGTILRDLLNKGREKIPTIISNDLAYKNNEAILTGKTPRLVQMIKETFGVSDNATLKLVLHNRYVLDTCMKNVPLNLTLKSSVLGGSDSRELFHQPSLIMNIYILYHPNGSNCIVSYFLFGQQSNVALLKKSNGSWKVEKNIVEHLM